jgi:hypothetical protein
MNIAKSICVVVVLAACRAFGAESARTRVMLVPEGDDRHWETVHGNEVALPLVWPQGATAAELTVAGMYGSLTTNLLPGLDVWVWQPPLTKEDLYELTLSFVGATNVLAARLAVTRGAFGPLAVDTGDDAGRWCTLRGGGVLIPWDIAWMNPAPDAAEAELSITSAARSASLSAGAGGWFGLALARDRWGYGAFEVSLVFPGAECPPVGILLARYPDGFLFSIK